MGSPVIACLVCFEFAPLHEDAICRNLVARDELHEVADNHLPRGHHVHLPAAHNLHVVVILDAVELSKLKLLDVVDVRLEEHDDANDDNDGDAFQVAILLAMFRHSRADTQRDDRGDAQDLNRDVFHRCRTQLEEGFRGRILELVRPKRLHARLESARRELVTVETE
jgi:hypothetical protein